MLWPVVKALLGHYKRHPLQIVLVWLGLTLGVSLLVGVLAINHHAKQSYSAGEKLFSNPLPYRIRPVQTASKIPQGFYVQLRREGFHQCMPFDAYRISTQTGLELTITGLDPVAMLELQQGASLRDINTLKLKEPPYPIMVSSDLASHLNWKDGDYIPLEDGSLLGPLLVDEQNLLSGTRVVADIALIRMLSRRTGFDLIACGKMPPEKVEKLKELLPNGMKFSQNTRAELDSLTLAFHTNLTALGMLSFFVGLFIFYQAMTLSFVQRQPLVGVLRQTGVSMWQLTLALVYELIFWILIAWLCGNVFGLFLANQLMPTVSASLEDLYNANVGLDIQWSWEWSKKSLLVAIMGTLLACSFPLFRLLRTQPARLSAKLSIVRFAGKEFTFQAMLACVFLIAAVAVHQANQTQESGFALIALLLISVGLFMPWVVWKIFNILSFSLTWVKARWFFADCAASMSYRGVAAMAFMLALATNIGVETMVGSFRETTDKWLTQRLAADVYVMPTNSIAKRMSSWLDNQDEVKEVWWRWEKDINNIDGTLQAVSTGNSTGEKGALTIKVAIPDYWFHLHHSQGVMVSESMAIKLGIRAGDYIQLPAPLESNWQVVGVYYDYGNPYNQVMLSHRNWLTHFANQGEVGLGIIMEDGAETSILLRKLNQEFKLSPERVYDNNKVHDQALKVFDRTFGIAGTLGNITLVIAVFGLFFATLAGEISRQRHFALLRCFGLSAKELVLLGGLQLLVLGAFSALIAIPLGLVLADLMIDVVLKQSFGWTMQLEVIPWEYGATFAWSFSALMIAGAWPVFNMVRKTPMKSLRDAL
ncbi:putative ABC-type antimicrobial peptide transport system, permease component [Vibrio nigripulchritudo SOn1]|uniref:ABC-type antimicrobial peptide transport system, permease component n=1 Tax=Vibrio nigripulchritudo SOn1 TaxID=1238450 RepID=A0AAV2VM97_9VIBR|nr:ABC transporter permease [Vibrio nigripulchritudo]CCO45666.1 putative ABC-type antimicrobial peptide transport system, permease component [Vibrio nigripulchritudo SOn1]